MADAAIIGSRVPARSLLLASTDPRSHPGDGRPFFGPNVTTLVVQHEWDGVLWPRPARRSAKGCAQSRSAALADMDRGLPRRRSITRLPAGGKSHRLPKTPAAAKGILRQQGKRIGGATPCAD